MLEITGSQIAKLDDEDLRTLVAKLCEAELSRCRLPLSAVTAGGNQNAPDGGIDVRVEIRDESVCLDFIPQPITGFQVKCQDMPPSEVIAEMRPGGHLRASISDLISAGGAYVIVSSQGSTADRALRARRKAMHEALGNTPGATTIHLDFYDRDRLARWVRCYPGVVLWVREHIHEQLSGWRGYSNWAFGDKLNSEYLFDDKGRIVSRQTGSHVAMNVQQGIAAIRCAVANPGSAIRLIGLSGTGKTRLVQALFDHRIGDDALDQGLVLYTDQGQETAIPSARDMLQQLGAKGTRAIVVVDNCNPTTHRALVQSVGAYSGTLSLITVEYDVAEDEPEETQVFELEPASEKVLEDILKRLTPLVSQVDRQRIASAELSGGNARIALALAKTIKRHESLGSLNDLELFKRLFNQRQENGEGLMHAAEACALVYSFDGETLGGEAAELPVLADLAGLSVQEVYRHVGTLHDRDLVQRRSRWRAVLPHAIANRLARQALRHIPTDSITQAFSQQGRERLLKSFSRRLSYLHDCEPATRIAEKWLSDWLAKPAQLNELGLALFHNVAPLVPEVALATIEAAAQGEAGVTYLSPDAPNRWRWVTLLRSLAYEPALFDRAALLLAKFYAREPEGHRHNSADRVFSELFHIYLSGTHASIEQRLSFIRGLLINESPSMQRCGLAALEAMLEANHFSSSHEFSFGARPRDFGWEPGTQEEIAIWFRAAVELVQEFSNAESQHHEHLRKMVARHFRSLWVHAGISDELERMAAEFSSDDGWPDGWIAVRATLRFDRNRMLPDLSERLRELESRLRPQGLSEKLRAYVLSRTHHLFDIVDGESQDGDVSGVQTALEMVSQTTEEIGRELAKTPDALNVFLPDLLVTGSGQCAQLGRGLAIGTPNLVELWHQCRNVLSCIPEENRSTSLLSGIIESASRQEPEVANRLLDEAVSDPILGSVFPILEASTQIGMEGAKRLTIALNAGLAPVSTYKCLCYGRVADNIPSTSFRDIVLGVADLPDGVPVAVDIFSMRLHSLKSELKDIDETTCKLGQGLLMRVDFEAGDDNYAYHIDEIAKCCLCGARARVAASKLCRALVRALSDYRSGAMHYGSLVGTLFELQPRVALDRFLGRRGKRRHRSLSRLLYLDRESPVNSAPSEVLLAWADAEPDDRYPKLAEEVRLYAKASDKAPLAWTPLAMSILEKAPNRKPVLDAYASRFRRGGRSGTLADELAPYLQLAIQLGNHPDDLLANWAKHMEKSLADQIEQEHQRDRRVDESFE
jgi:hypothetical protein